VLGSRWVAVGTVVGGVTLVGGLIGFLEGPGPVVGFIYPGPFVPPAVVLGAALVAVMAGGLRFMVAPRIVGRWGEAVSRWAGRASGFAMMVLFVGAVVFVRAEVIRLGPVPTLP